MMKVTRLKKGYRLSLSDPEMGVLINVLADGFMSHEADEEWDDVWMPSEKSALTRRLKKVGSAYRLLAIDEDRRA